MKRRPKKAPKVAWIAWCPNCGRVVATEQSQRKSKSWTCYLEPGCGRVSAELYVLDSIAMANADHLRAELTRANEEIHRLRESRNRLDREHGKRRSEVF